MIGECLVEPAFEASLAITVSAVSETRAKKVGIQKASEYENLQVRRVHQMRAYITGQHVAQLGSTLVNR
jgi:hypothetical protein